MPSGTIAGKLSSSTAKILGLKEGTIIAIEAMISLVGP